MVRFVAAGSLALSGLASGSHLLTRVSDPVLMGSILKTSGLFPSNVRALGTKLTQRLNGLSFTHKKEFIVWYSEAKREDTRARRLEKMKQMLSMGRVIS